MLETETCPTPPAGSARSSARNSQGTGYRRLAEAEPLVRRALEVDEKSCGAAEPNTRMLRGTSTAWPFCLKPPTGWLGPSR